MKRTDQLLGTLGEVEPRRDLVGLVIQHIEREQETIPAFKRFLISLRERRPQLQYAAANILLVIVLALMLYQYQARRSPVTESTVANLPKGRGKATGADADTRSRRAPFWRRVKIRFPTEPRVAGERRDFRIPLNEADVEKLNLEMKRALTGVRGPNDGPLPPRLPEVLPVEARAGPPIILRPGPNGTLVIEPGPEDSKEPTEE